MGSDNFMSFACWYSLHKNLPDANILLACERPEEMKMDLFQWVYRLQIPFFYYQKTDPITQAIQTDKATYPILTLPCDTICLDTLDHTIIDKINDNKIIVGEELCLSAKNPETAVFCSLKEGVGAFVPSRWIYRGSHPFKNADMFSKGDLTMNERRIFQLWKKLGRIFDTLV